MKSAENRLPGKPTISNGKNGNLYAKTAVIGRIPASGNHIRREMMTDYSRLPEHCREGMKRYIEHGIIPGDFLQAVICNNLVETFAIADDTNIKRLCDYAFFLYWDAPSPCWGSKKKMSEWADSFHPQKPDLSEDDYRDGGR